MIALRFLLILPVILIIQGCAAHTNLEPVGKGNLTANISIGGPVVSAFGIKLPVPYATIGANYGIDKRLDLNSNFHLLTVAYNIVGFDFGPTLYPVLNQGVIPSIGIQPRFMMLVSVKSEIPDRMKIYPLLSASAAWKADKGFIYIGFDSLFYITPSLYNSKASSTIFSPFGGYCWKIGRKTFFITEVKWQAFNVSSDQLAVEYLSLGNHGAITPLLSLMRSF